MDFLDNTRIGTKLIGSFLTLAILLGIVAGIGIVNMNSMMDTIDHLYLDTLVPINHLGEANADFFQFRGDVYKYLTISKEREKTLTHIKDDISQVNQHIETFRSASHDETEKAELEKFDAAWTVYQKEITVILDLINSGKEQEAMDSLGSDRMTESEKAVSDSINTLLETNVNDGDITNIQSDNTLTSTTLIVVLIGIFSAIFAIVLGLVISRSITIPLKSAGEMLSELSRGHLGIRLSMNRKDEIGVMAQTMDLFGDNLQKNVVETMHKIARGEKEIALLTASGDKDEIAPALNQMNTTIRDILLEVGTLIRGAQEGRLKDRGDSSRFIGGYQEIILGINKMLDSMITPLNEAMRLSTSYANGDYIDRFNEQLSINGDFIPFKVALDQIGIQGSNAIGGVKVEIETLTAGMEETNASAEEVASTTNVLARGASSVSSLAEQSGTEISQTLTAMEDLSSTVSAVATKAEQASTLAKQTVDLSERGVTLAGKAEKGMEGIIDSVDETSEIITDITSQMEEIGKIVNIITGISEQTGLLALNAAIEAARAGDAGRGFAVVADEVKSLALESQKSAENIAIIIGNLQKKSELASDSMKTSATEVKAGNAAVSETLDVFNQIVQAINMVHNNMTEVAGATEEQAASVEEITASVHEVSSLVQQTAQEAVDSAAATEEVTASIHQITGAISEAAISVQKISEEMGKFTTA